MKRKIKILLVEDSPTMAALYSGYLDKEDYIIEHVETGREALEKFQKNLPNLMLLDLNLPDIHGMEILKYVHENKLPIEVIIITAHNSVDFAIDAIRLGALDYLVKPFDGKRFVVTVKNALKQQEMSMMLETYRENFSRDNFHGFIGASLEMQSIYRIIESAASSRATIFITGESGTGKEVCASAIHLQSNRAKKPFVAINCAAIPKDLVESEVFGHVKGAFTGAVSARDGAATRAHGGTLFLDEICEMDLALQSKLLRFTQTGTFQKVGGSKEEDVDVRMICATNCDPMQEVKSGHFREDLYFRLHVIPIHLQPLRDRENDCLLIVDSFLKQYANEEGKAFKGFSEKVESVFLNYEWPGNVRELQNLIRQIVVLNDADLVTNEMLPRQFDQINNQISKPIVFSQSKTQNEEQNKMSTVGDDNIIRPLWMEERDIIERAISICDGNIPKAAVMLDISPSTIYRKKQGWHN